MEEKKINREPLEFLVHIAPIVKIKHFKSVSVVRVRMPVFRRFFSPIQLLEAVGTRQGGRYLPLLDTTGSIAPLIY